MRYPLMLGLLFVPLSRAALAQCPDGSPPPCRSGVAARPAPPPAANSIAVLYFDNLSRDSADTYLADGFTEEVMSRLTQVERLQVKSRTAVQRLRARASDDPVAVGRSLGVAHLVTGSVLRGRGRLRVNVELTRIATGNSVWSRSFDRSADDLIGAEAEIAESVATQVGARLAPSEVRRIEARSTRSAQAYDHLLRGKFEATRRTTSGLTGALREFETALRFDSMLTPALLGLANTYGQLGAGYYDPAVGLPRESLQARGDAALMRAMRQDSLSADVLLARAYRAPAAQARPWLARAVTLEPRNAEAHHSFALTLRILGEDSAAVAEFRRAVDIEPDRVISLINLGQVEVLGRRYGEARLWMDSAVALGPEAAFYYLERGLNQLLLGDTAAARASAEQVAAHGSLHGREEIVAMLEARHGDSAAARSRMLRVDSAMTGRDCFVSHECLELALSLASAGLKDRALAVMERLRPRAAWLAYWSGRPELDPIRDDPRFQRLLAESRTNARAAR